MLVVAFALIASPAFAVDVDARIGRIGLFAGSNPIIRPGVWSFVEVELRTRAEKPFDGQLRVDQLDRDGDVITSVLPVALAPGADWRPYQVFFVPYDQEQAGNLRVRIFDVRGRLQTVQNQLGVEVTELEPEHRVIEIRPDDYLLVDLSAPKRLPHVAWLDYDRQRQGGQTNARKVRSMPPGDLPTRAVGLEAVDAIVWDDADPSGLSQQQCDALIEWVKAGGRLLITSGKNWQALAGSPLATALPVTISGISQVTEAQDFTDLVEGEDYKVSLERRYLRQPIRRCAMKPIEGAIPIPADDRPFDKIAYRLLLGRGMVTFVGASLMQLMPPSRKMLAVGEEDVEAKAGKSDEDFIPIACEKVTARRLLSLPPVLEEEGGGGRAAWQIGLSPKTDLFAKLRDTIGFESVGTAFLLFAIVFAVAYTLVATTGSFWYMKRKSWQHHSWSAFALVAIACSVVGTGMVWVLRGFTTKLWQTTIIDSHAGSDQGQATALFGVKTPDHMRLNLRLPIGGQTDILAETCPIRPMPKSELFEGGDSRFVASEEYQSAKAGTELMSVPLRATLKEFQGAWRGSLAGTLNGRLVVKKNAGEDAERIKYDLAEGSYLHNELGVTLRDCLLILMPPDTNEEVMGERSFVGGHCYSLGDLAKTGDGSKLSTEQLRGKFFYINGAQTPSAVAGKPGDESDRRKTLPQLSDSLGDWYRQFTFLAGDVNTNRPRTFTPRDEYTACLLLSMYNLLRPDSANRLQLIRSHGRALDCTHEITKRTALLIGWSDEASPVVLEKGLTALRPDKARTIYRITIPVEKK